MITLLKSLRNVLGNQPLSNSFVIASVITNDASSVHCKLRLLYDIIHIKHPYGWMKTALQILLKWPEVTILVSNHQIDVDNLFKQLRYFSSFQLIWKNIS